MLKIYLLGKFNLIRAGNPITIPSRHAQSLLAYLVLTAGTKHRREKLAGMLWPEASEESARDYLRHALWKIRKTIDRGPTQGKLDTYILADDLDVGFNAEADYSLDVALLGRINDSASKTELIAALKLYEGELLPGFYDEWVVLEREHLQAVFEHHMARLLAFLQDEGRWLEVLEWAEHWISLGQSPEPAYQALMSAHAAKGDMSKAALTYDRCLKSLLEIGVEPSEQTRNIYEDLKAGRQKARKDPATAHYFDAVKTTPETNLPTPLTSFIGREKEVQEIVTLLGKNRLVTLVGSGGVGKTRLAIESGNTLLAEFKDGVWWIELVGLTDPSLVAWEVAKVLDTREIPDQPMLETLVKHLGSKQQLLVLDNCEHLITACAQMADLLLSGSKNLKILTTSREALDILGETIFQVPSLSLPDKQESMPVEALSKYESVRLFDERAKLINSVFQLSDQNAQIVVQICRRLSGIPLAIELAAARVRMMTVDEIAKRLDDRFDLLTSGYRTTLARHQTLRATIDWSYELLTDLERMLFRRLAVFAGGFMLEAAEAVCGQDELKRRNVLDVLGRLVDKSLVTAEQSVAAGETRYRLLETIREYAREKLEEAGEVDAVRERHLEFFAAFARRAEKGIYSSEQPMWFGRLEKEADNLRAAMDWPDLDVGIKNSITGSIQKNRFLIIGSITMFWEINYQREIIEILKKILAVDVSNTPTMERAKALATGGFMLWSLNNLSDARTYLEESIEIAEQLSDNLTLAWALSYLGWTFDFLGEYDPAKTSLERSVAIARTLGEDGKHVIGMSLALLGDIPYGQGDVLEARKLYEEAILFLREINNKNMLTYPLRRLGYISLHEKNIDKAAQLFRESLELNRQIGHYAGMISCLAGFAAIKLAQGDIEKAAILCDCVDQLRQRTGALLFFVDTVEYKRCTAQLKKILDENGLSASLPGRRLLMFEEAVAFVLEET